MKIKKGDTIKILRGKDSGKTGKVLQLINPASSVKTKRKQSLMVVVEGLNLRFKHLRPKKGGESGQRIMFPAPVDISNVQIVCPKCGKPTRVGYKTREGKSEVSQEKKNRICKKCKGVF